MRLAQIEGGIVVNVIEADPAAIPDWAADWPEVVGGASIGWLYEGGDFVAPPESAPEEIRASMPTITARQLRLALLPRLDEVESLIEASYDRALQIEWEYATTFERLHPAIVSIGDALGMTPEEIDALWLDAANT